MLRLVLAWVLSTGVPLPYGIDITPDGKAWVARMHTDELASVDPATGVVTMIKTPFRAPRRLRSDRDGNLWIVAFNESKIARYAPRWTAFVGIGAYATAFARKGVRVGLQSEAVEGSRVWVLPNTSGLNAHYTPAAFVEVFRELHRAAW